MNVLQFSCIRIISLFLFRFLYGCNFKFSVCSSLLRLDNDGVNVEVMLANHLAPTYVTKSAPVRSTMPLDGGPVNVMYGGGSRKGFFDGVFGCLRPVLTFIGKAAAAELKSQGIPSNIAQNCFTVMKKREI